MTGIYKITNKINGKCYIGQSIHCDKRFKEHCCGKKQFIDETIQLEGIENFSFELLEECEQSELDKREDYYIQQYNTMFPNGYNKRWNINTKRYKSTEVKLQPTLTDNELKQILYKDSFLFKIFLLMKQIFIVSEDIEECTFTKRDILFLLGYDCTKEENYYEVMINLALLQYYQLISLKTKMTKSKYSIYMLQSVYNIEL